MAFTSCTVAPLSLFVCGFVNGTLTADMCHPAVVVLYREGRLVPATVEKLVAAEATYAQMNS